MGKALKKGISLASKMNIIAAIAIAGILALTSLAYVSSATAENTTPLEGVTWVLKSYGAPDNLTAAVPDKEVTLTFNKDRKEASGSGGVNGYGGNYEVNRSRLTVSGVIHTMMAGPEPLMGQENAFFSILESAESFQIDGKQLTLTGTEGILVFSQK